MCRPQYVVALVALFVGLAHSLSWDYVVTTNTTLKFYNDETLTHSEDFEFGIQYLTYDAVQNRLLFLDRENTRYIFLHSLNLATMERQFYFMIKLKNDYDYISSLAYDPFTELVYFSDQKGIFWFSLKPGFKNNFNGNLLIKTSTHYTIVSIAVDSCRGYIYWTSIQKGDSITKMNCARLNGSDEKFLFLQGSSVYDYLVTDQQTQKLYFIIEIYEKPYEFEYYIQFRDFNEKQKTRSRSLYVSGNYEGLQKKATKALTVSKDFVYWMDWESTVWKLQKNSTWWSDVIITNYFTSPHNSIVANYKIEDQTQGVRGCQALISKQSVSNDNSLNVSTNESLVCHNYCVQGNCIVIEGQAICRCNAGYSGDRCALDICQGYCLNGGDCYLNEKSEPVCQCKGGYTGERCAVSVFLMKSLQTASLLKEILNTDVTPVALDYGLKSTCQPEPEAVEMSPQPLRTTQKDKT